MGGVTGMTRGSLSTEEREQLEQNYPPPLSPPFQQVVTMKGPLLWSFCVYVQHNLRSFDLSLTVGRPL